MANYDFQTLLSPLDFEHLVRDLLSKDLKLELSAFAEGKDSGIDLRYSKNQNNNIIVQCKRVKNISKEQIQNELPKINKLNPQKYYFVVSCDLSVKKFDFLKEIFNKWMKNDDSYIYSRTRLNNLLDQFDDIHHKNYKLWLNSSKIFNSIINQPLYERAKSLISDLQKNYKYYVKNESLYKAIEMVNANKFIVISGIPGIGKTTLAKLILWEYLQKGFEIIEIHKVKEGEQILVEDSETNQVYYFDDFLGENFLKYDVVEGRSNDLIQFIKRVKNSKNKILVMTTREYILNQAKETYEKLDSDDLNIAKYTLDLSSYSKKIRSLILYNHLFYSETPIEYIEQLIKDKAYQKIINHKNYSPRIIEQLTIKLSNISVDNYVEEFIRSLDYPLGIWNKAFNSQISEGSKTSLFILLSISNRILLSDFKKALDYAYANGTQKRGIEFRPFDYKNYLKELENSFIKTNLTNKHNHYVDFLNPSIKDFLLSIVKDDIEIIRLLLDSCLYFNQFIYVVRYISRDYLKNEKILDIIDNIILEKFDLFANPTTIMASQNEYNSRLSDIEKISGLNFYLGKTKNKSVFEFIKSKFQAINVSSLYTSDEKKYVQFFKEHHKKLDIDFEEVVNQIATHMEWFDNVENLWELKDFKKKTFDKYVEKNKEALRNKIKDSIRKEIEFYENSDYLLEFKDTVRTTIDLSLFSISITEFDSYFEEKLDELNELEISDDDNMEIKIDKLDFTEDDEFNEDQIFKLEMFS